LDWFPAIGDLDKNLEKGNGKALIQPAKLPRMSTFVLVHGAWQSTATWDLLAPLLEKYGHTVIRPVLSGLGTDQDHLSSEITLGQHVKDVLIELSKLPDKAILVGHSYAGMIISGVVEADPSHVQRLVFMDAFVPDDGQSALDLLPAHIGIYFHDVAQAHGDGWRLPAGEGQLDLWGLKPGEARARGCAISACVVLTSPFPCLPIARPAFHRPTSAAWLTDIRRNRSSSHLQKKRVPLVGRSRNFRLVTIATSNAQPRSRIFYCRQQRRGEV
jgi:pimeloyl-ACP methyl ester carboxylesterase